MTSSITKQLLTTQATQDIMYKVRCSIYPCEYRWHPGSVGHMYCTFVTHSDGPLLYKQTHLFIFLRYDSLDHYSTPSLGVCGSNLLSIHQGSISTTTILFLILYLGYSLYYLGHSFGRYLGLCTYSFRTSAPPNNTIIFLPHFVLPYPVYSGSRKNHNFVIVL